MYSSVFMFSLGQREVKVHSCSVENDDAEHFNRPFAAWLRVYKIHTTQVKQRLRSFFSQQRSIRANI